jgi:hypothetical protein
VTEPAQSREERLRDGSGRRTPADFHPRALTLRALQRQLRKTVSTTRADA